jgi:SAM-dependent methyltransferase
MSDDAVARLRAEVVAGAEPEAVPEPETPTVVSSGLRARVKAVIRKAIGWYVDQTARDAADRVRDELAPKIAEQQRRLDAGSEQELRALTINLELLKGELRGLQLVLDELGEAIAPAAGIAGATARMGELRDKVHAIDRRLRAATQSRSQAQPASSLPEPAPGAAAGFDYVGFERRFRGDPQAVVAMEAERYLPLLRDHDPVLDVGCGRGELVEALLAAGVDASGVDLDEAMAADAAARGLPVRHGDAIGALRALPEASLGAIVSLHVIEHLELASLLELLALAATRLRPGGVFVAETPNPASLVVLGNSYVLDPTHVRPLHPSLMVFLCEDAGFRDVRLEFYSPAESYRLPLVDDADAPPWAATVNAAFDKLNETLFGPQEYAVVATRGT